MNIRRDYFLQNEQDKNSDIKLWDLVKNSTKKLKTNKDYSSSPKKVVSKTTFPQRLTICISILATKR